MISVGGEQLFGDRLATTERNIGVRQVRKAMKEIVLMIVGVILNFGVIRGRYKIVMSIGMVIVMMIVIAVIIMIGRSMLCEKLMSGFAVRVRNDIVQQHNAVGKKQGKEYGRSFEH